MQKTKQFSANFLRNRWQQAQILVIGDVMLDEYLEGKVERISPEAPVPVVSLKRQSHRLGGAANVALNLQALGATPFLVALVGVDKAGEDLEAVMKASGLNTSGLIKDQTRPTTIKTRIISGSQQLLRLDKEETHYINADLLTIAQDKIAANIAMMHAIVIEDYDKGMLAPTLIAFILKMANQLQIPVVVDPKKKQFLCYQGVDLFKPNLKELKEGLGLTELIIQKPHFEALVQAAQSLQAKLMAKNLLVTLSEHGAFYSNQYQWGVEPAHLRQIADVSGAGDTVISVAALGMATQLPLSLVAALANLAGGLVCELPGVVSIEKDKFFSEAVAHQMLIE